MADYDQAQTDAEFRRMVARSAPWWFRFVTGRLVGRFVLIAVAVLLLFVWAGLAMYGLVSVFVDLGL